MQAMGCEQSVPAIVSNTCGHPNAASYRIASNHPINNLIRRDIHQINMFMFCLALYRP